MRSGGPLDSRFRCERANLTGVAQTGLVQTSPAAEDRLNDEGTIADTYQRVSTPFIALVSVEPARALQRPRRRVSARLPHAGTGWSC